MIHGTFEVPKTAWEPAGQLFIRDANNPQHKVMFASREQRDNWLVGAFGERKAAKLLRKQGKR